MSTKHQTKRSTSSLPTLDEVPLTPDGISFVDDFTRLMMIPPDDAAFRTIVINRYKRDELDNISSDPSRNKDRLPSPACYPARTPGGVAWKISDALHQLRLNHDPDDWPRPHQLLQSAIGDALDLERRRAMSIANAGPDVTVALVERIWQNIEEEMASDEDVGGKLIYERMALQRLLAKTPATSFDGVIAKMRAVANMLAAGLAPDGRDTLLLKSTIADIERLTGKADAQEPADEARKKATPPELGEVVVTKPGVDPVTTEEVPVKRTAKRRQPSVPAMAAE